MPRIHVELPTSFNFSTELEVTVGYINYGGHLGNDSLMTILHEARMRYFESLGFTEMNAGGPGIIMVDAAVEYKSECFRGDRIRIQVAVEDPAARGCDICYLVTNLSTGTIVAKAKTGILFFDYATRKAVPVPRIFLEKAGLAGVLP